MHQTIGLHLNNGVIHTRAKLLCIQQIGDIRRLPQEVLRADLLFLQADEVPPASQLNLAMSPASLEKMNMILLVFPQPGVLSGLVRQTEHKSFLESGIHQKMLQIHPRERPPSIGPIEEPKPLILSYNPVGEGVRIEKIKGLLPVIPG